MALDHTPIAVPAQGYRGDMVAPNLFLNKSRFGRK